MSPVTHSVSHQTVVVASVTAETLQWSPTVFCLHWTPGSEERLSDGRGRGLQAMGAIGAGLSPMESTSSLQLPGRQVTDTPEVCDAAAEHSTCLLPPPTFITFYLEKTTTSGTRTRQKPPEGAAGKMEQARDHTLRLVTEGLSEQSGERAMWDTCLPH